MKPWAVYTRVSTDEQADYGVSLEVQEAACRAHLRQRNLVVGHVFRDDGFTGYETKRPGYQKLLHLVEQRAIGGVVINAITRMHRNLFNLMSLVNALHASGLCLVTVTEGVDSSTPHGLMLIQQLGSFAEFFRNEKSAEIKRALGYLQNQGCWTGGGLPTGFAVEVRNNRKYLIPHPQHAPILRKMWALIAEGASLMDAARFLTQAQVPTRSGKPWSRNAVSGLLRQKRAPGVLTDRETYDRARAALSTRARTYPIRHTASTSIRTWPLQGIAVCALCGAALVGSTTYKQKKPHHYLRCSGSMRRGREVCDAGPLPAKEWERAVATRLCRLFGTPEATKLMALEIQRHAAELGPAQERLRAVEAKRDQVKVRIDRAMDMALEGGSVARAAQAKIGEMQVEYERLCLDAAELAGATSALAIDHTMLESASAGIAARIEILLTAPETVQAQLFKIVLKRVRIASGENGELELWPLHELLAASNLEIHGQVCTNSEEWLRSDAFMQTCRPLVIPFEVHELRGPRGVRLVVCA